MPDVPARSSIRYVVPSDTLLQTCVRYTIPVLFMVVLFHVLTYTHLPLLCGDTIGGTLGDAGLPTQVRDAALALDEKMPTGIVNREYWTQNAEAALADGINPLDAAQGPSKGHALLKKLARTTPYYKRNQAQICSFWVKGECRRGAECPYRHEMPTNPDDPLAKQNMKDRFVLVL